MIRLAVRMLRNSTGGFLAAFIAVFFGAAIVMACGGLMESGIRDNVPPQRLAAAPIVVTGDPSYRAPGVEDGLILPERVRLDSAALRTISALPGVAAAVPDVAAPAAIGSRNPVAFDVRDWATAPLAPYALLSGRAPAAPGQLVLDRGTAARADAQVGDRVRVVVRGRAESFTVTGIAAAPAAADQPTAFVTGAALPALLARPDRVDAIAVRARPGTPVPALRNRIQSALPHASVLTGGERGFAEFPEARTGKETLVVMAGVFGGLGVLVAIFVIASTLALTAQHRQRELALLRTIGLTPRQLRRMILFEALAVAVLATGLAILPGRLLGRFLFGQLADHDVIPAQIVHYQGGVPLLTGCGAAVLATVVAAIVAGRRSGRIRPLQALAEAQDGGSRWLGAVRLILALLFLGGGFALLLVTMTVMSGPAAASTAGPSIMTWAIGFALLGPAVTRSGLAVLHWPVRLFVRLPGRLALQNFRVRSVAMAAAVVPVMLATGLATANLYMQTTGEHASDQAFLKNLRADAVLTSGPGGFPAGTLDRVRHVPGVRAASDFVPSTGAIDSPRYSGQDEDGLPLQGIDGDAATAVTGIRVASGDLARLQGAAVALPARLAAHLHLRPGDRMQVRLGDRTAVAVRVVATFAGQKGYDTLLLPADLLAAHTTTGAAEQIMVRAAADPARVTAALHSVAAGIPGAAVADRQALIRHNREGEKIQAWINYLLVGTIVAYTVVSVVNTLVAGTARRRREFGLQRLAGATRSQVMRMMGTEGFLVAVVGIALGTAVALLTLLPYCAALGGPALPQGPLWIYGTIAGVALVLTMTTTLFSTWAALRSPAAEAV